MGLFRGTAQDDPVFPVPIARERKDWCLSVTRIAVIGSWHLASVLGAGLAELGHAVVGWDEDGDGTLCLARAEPLVDEPGLRELLRAQLGAGRLRYTSELHDALTLADFTFIAHDTPVQDDDSPDLAVVERSVRLVARAAHGPMTLVVSSQVPIGTSRRLRDIAASERADLPWIVACVPEFLQLGQALERFREPDRVVVGAEERGTAEAILSLFRPGVPAVITTLETAEMIKHASNAFLATSISFINEIGDICEASGADVVTVARAMRMDRRIGSHAFLDSGLGFAGGTLGRDIRALEDVAAASNARTPLLDAVMLVNAARADMLFERLIEVTRSTSLPTVCLLGLTYKAGTSTLRRSIALDIARRSLKRGWSVRAHDPAATGAWSRELPEGLELLADVFEAAAGATVTVVLTDWPEYRDLDLRELRSVMGGDCLLDCRNLYDPDAAVRARFSYWGMGRRAK